MSAAWLLACWVANTGAVLDAGEDLADAGVVLAPAPEPERTPPPAPDPVAPVAVEHAAPTEEPAPPAADAVKPRTSPGQWWVAVGPSWTVATDLLGGDVRLDVPFLATARHTPAASLGVALQYGVGGSQRLLLAFPLLASVRLGLSESGVQLIPAVGGALYRMAKGAMDAWGAKFMGALTVRFPFVVGSRVGLLLGADVLVGDGVALRTTVGVGL